MSAVALDGAHSVAFHTGLGAPVYPSPSTPYHKYVNEEYIASYADVVYSKPNFALVADGAGAENISTWVGQFFKDVPASSQSGQTLKTEATKYHGGEQRTNHTAGNAVVIAFPGSDIAGSKPEVNVLASLLGGESTIKWSPGYSLLSKTAAEVPGLSISASNLAGLLNVQISGPAAAVRKGTEATVAALKSIAEGKASKEDVAKAVANAKFNLLSSRQLRETNVHLAGTGVINTGKAYDVAATAKALDSVTAEKLAAVR